MTLDATPTRAAAGMHSVTKLLQARVNDPLEYTGTDRRFSTGMLPLDEVLGGGIRRQDLVLIVGRPGAGKTTVALQWARALAVQGVRSIYVCFDHSEADLLERFTMLEMASAGREECTGLESRGAGDTRGAARPDPARGRPGSRPADMLARIEPYGGRLDLVAASRRYDGIDAIEKLLPDQAYRDTVLFVDYLQRIPTRGTQFASDDDRVGYLAESLKDLALRRNIAVVAVAAADKDALSKRRLRMHDIRGSSAALYEADTVLVLNEKRHALPKTHLAYGADRAERAMRSVVMSVEKNRNGAADLDMEFVTDLAHFAIDPDGAFLTEDLVDEVLFLK